MWKIFNSLMILLSCIAFITSCSVDKNIVKENEKIIAEEDRFSDPKITYISTVASFTKQQIIIDLKKIETIKKEKVITKQYHSIEHRTLRFVKKEDNTFASGILLEAGPCCTIAVLPYWLIHVPSKMIESIDEDHGIRNENFIKYMDIEKPLDINEGYILLKEENLKIHVSQNKVIINLEQLSLKQGSYNFELYEGDIAKKMFTLEIEYSGDLSEDYLAGGQNNLKIGVDSNFNATLVNQNNFDIPLNNRSDGIYFILNNGQQIEGILNVDYPSKIIAHSFVNFNIGITEYNLFSSIKRAQYQIPSQGVTISLFPAKTKDTRVIENVLIKE